jgi:hypothetical protein
VAAVGLVVAAGIIACGAESSTSARRAMVAALTEAPVSYDASALLTETPPAAAQPLVDAGACPDWDAGDGGDALSRVPIGQMESVIRSQFFPRARRCYQRRLETDPEEEGRIVIKLKVDPDGAVAEVETLSNTGLSAETEACMLRSAKLANFGCNPGGVIQIPINFIHQRPDAGLLVLPVLPPKTPD